MTQLVLILVLALSWTSATLASPTTDKELVQKFRRVFESPFWPEKPEKTLELLGRLEKLLAWKKDVDSIDRRQRIQKLIGHSNNIEHKCDLEAAERLSDSIRYHKYVRKESGASIRRYLEDLRDKTFELCQEEFTKSVNDAELRLKAHSRLGSQAIRLKQLFVDQFKDPSVNTYLTKKPPYPLLAAFMDEQAGAPINVKSMSLQEFSEQFKLIVTDTCQVILDRFRIYSKMLGIVTRKVVKQMDKTVVDWFIARDVCLDVNSLPEIAEKNVYAQLAARKEELFLRRSQTVTL